MRRSNAIERARESLRLITIYYTLFRFAFELILDRGWLGDFRRRMQQFIFSPPQPVVPLSAPVKVRLMIQELGPTFIKVGQIISSRSENLPDDWQEELNRLQANVPPFEYETVRQTLIEDLGAPPEEIYATFDPKPLAAASTAQVHRATLHDGQKVVVKVQRPNIRQQMRADLGIMRTAVRIAERRSARIRNFDVSGMLEEFGQSALKELDYRGEAYNAVRLGKNLEDMPGVHVASVYPTHSSSRVLTQQFVRGVKITNVEALEAAGFDLAKLADAQLRSAVKQLMVDGFFHGDPHPGNVLVDLDSGLVTYIDLGMIGQLSLSQRANVVRLLYSMQQQDADRMADVMRALSVSRREADVRAYRQEFERRISRHWMPGVVRSFSGMLNDVFDVLEEYGMALDTQLTLGVKFLIQLDAVTKRLIPQGELVPMAVDMLGEMLLEQATPENIKNYLVKEVSHVASEVLQRLPSLEEATLSWLGQIQRGQFSVRLDTSQLDDTVSRLRGFSSQLLVGLMLVGMIIGSAIATSMPVFEGEFWSFVPRLAVLGYTFSIVLAAILILRLVWNVFFRRE